MSVVLKMKMTLWRWINNLGEAAAPPADLASSLVSDIAAEYQTLIEADWEANVLNN